MLIPAYSSKIPYPITKYLAFIGSQFMHVCGPVVTSFINDKKYYNIADLLENRDNVEFLIN